MFPRAAAGGGSGLKKPLQGLLAPLECVGVGLVVDEHTAPGRPHQADIAQDPEVLRHGALGDAEQSGESPDAERPAGDQVENAQAHLDGKRSQKTRDFGNVFHGLIILVSTNILMNLRLVVKGEIPFTRAREERWSRYR